MLFDKTTQLPNLLVFSPVEIETVSFPVSDLEEIVIKSFFDNPDFICCAFQVHMNYFPRFVEKTSVKFPPKGHLLDYFLNGLFLLFGLATLAIFNLCILGPLFFLENIQFGPYFLPESQFQAQFNAIQQAQSREMYLFFIFFLKEKILFLDISWQNEPKNVQLPLFVVVAH